MGAADLRHEDRLARQREAAEGERVAAVMQDMARRLAPVAADRRGSALACGRYTGWFATEAAARRAEVLLADALADITRGRSCGCFEIAGRVVDDLLTRGPALLIATE